MTLDGLTSTQVSIAEALWKGNENTIIALKLVYGSDEVQYVIDLMVFEALENGLCTETNLDLATRVLSRFMLYIS